MSDMDRKTLSKLLRAMGDSLQTMNDREFDLLLQGKGTLKFTPTKGTVIKPEVEQNLSTDVAEVARQLENADSRETAKDVISMIKHRRRKEFLLLVAQKSGVHVEKRDSIARIEQKLIETIVGSKLRTQAFKEVAF
jgi:hypothetical protein